MITLEYPDDSTVSVVVNPPSSGASSSSYVTPDDYGWTVASTPTESTAAVRAAIVAASANGKTLRLLHKYEINEQIVLPDALVIEGSNARACGFVITAGVSPAPALLAENVVPPKFRRVGFFGNNLKDAPNYTPGAFELRMTSAYAADMHGFEMIDCYQENFALDIWNRIRVVDNPNYDIVAPVVRGNTYKSMNGNNQGYDNLGRQSSIWNVQGYKDAPTPPTAGQTIKGVVRDGVWDDVYADGTHLKNYIFLWGGTRNCAVRNVTLDNFGASTLADKGAYAVASYGDRNPSLPEAVGRYDPDGNTYTNIRIIRPFSCGIYFAQVNNAVVRGCVVSGQYDTTNSGLPKGGIVVNGATGSNLVQGNRLTDCFVGIAITDCKEASTVLTSGNEITGSTANALGIRHTGAQTAAANFIVNIISNVVKLVGTDSVAIKIANGDVNFGDTAVKGNFLSAKLHALTMTRNPSVLAGRRLDISENHFEGQTAGDMIHIDPTVSLIHFGANEYDMRHANGNGIVITNCTRVLIDGVQQIHDKKNVAGTYAFSADGAQGQIQVPISFNGTIGSGQRSSASAMGLSKPTWTAEPGDRVMALAPVLSGSSIVNGWVRASNGSWYGMQSTAV